LNALKLRWYPTDVDPDLRFYAVAVEVVYSAAAVIEEPTVALDGAGALALEEALDIVGPVEMQGAGALAPTTDFYAGAPVELAGAGGLFATLTELLQYAPDVEFAGGGALAADGDEIPSGPPVAPTSLAAQLLAGPTVRLTWDGDSADVYRRDVTAGTAFALVDAAETSPYADAGAFTQGHTYAWRVTNAGGTSGTVSLVPNPNPPNPGSLQPGGIHIGLGLGL
jgi:hypothetical protein